MTTARLQFRPSSHARHRASSRASRPRAMCVSLIASLAALTQSRLVMSLFLSPLWPRDAPLRVYRDINNPQRRGPRARAVELLFRESFARSPLPLFFSFLPGVVYGAITATGEQSRSLTIWTTRSVNYRAKIKSYSQLILKFNYAWR